MTSALPGLGPPHSLRLQPSDLLWGIDSDTRRVSVAVLRAATEEEALRADIEVVAGLERLGVGPWLQWRTCSLPGSAQSPVHLRQSRALGRLVPFFHALCVEWGRPTLVTVEEPFSQNSNSGIQDRSLGVVLAALGLELGIGTDVRLMNPGEWKKPATGHGYRPGLPKAASKAEKRVAEKARLMAWAREAGYTGESQDEADACGVVVGAAVMLEARRSR